MKKSLLLAIGCIASVVASAKEPTTGWQPHKQLMFVENKGQITDQYGQQRPDVQFKIESPAVNMYIGGGQLHYQWQRTSPNPSKGGELNAIAQRVSPPLEGRGEVSTYRMDVTLVGANTNAQVVTEEKQAYVEHNFASKTDQKGIDASAYKKITYKDIYPNIDWVFYISNQPGKENTVAYDFVVRQGGKVSDIQLTYGGATSLNVNNNGDLTVTTPFGSVTEQAPYSYTVAGATKQAEVASRFSLHGNTLSFNADSHTGTLVIDPLILWATYFGGTGFDLGFNVTTDHAGNVYISGTSWLSSNITTTGSYQINDAGDFDGYLAKFNSAGDEIWSTFYGGTGTDYIYGMQSDGYGAIYLSGTTNGGDGIATTGSHQATKSGSDDDFLAKFDTSGHPVWATYFGGTGDEQGGFCALDGKGHIFLSGYTNSTVGLATVNVHQGAYGGGDQDAFLARFDTAGNLNWATYFGSDSTDYGEGIACDANGNAFIAGRTNSIANIATTGAYQGTNAGNTDEYIAKFDSTGSLKWATYYGGPGSDWNSGVHVITSDIWGDIFLSGKTSSTSGITTSNAAQGTYGGGDFDAFLVKFDGNGNIKWGTYYGGSATDYGQNAACDALGNVFLCGMTESTNNIATPNSIQDTIFASTSYDGYLVEFDSAGTRQWATYYGGGQGEDVEGVALDDSGRVYMTGSTTSPTNIATPGSFEPAFANGFSAVFLVKYCYDVVTPPVITGADSICANSSQTYTVPEIPGASAYLWNVPAPLTGSSTTNSIQVTNDTTSGTSTLSLRVVKCNDTSNSQTISIYTRRKIPAIITAASFVLTTMYIHSTYQWYLNGQAIPNATGATYTATQNGSYTVKVTNPGGCTDSSAAFPITGVSVQSIEQIAKAIIIYPNPANSVVHIMSPVAVNVTISSMDGKLVLQQQQAKDVNVTDLATGIYMLRITDSNGTLVKTEKLTKVNQ